MQALSHRKGWIAPARRRGKNNYNTSYKGANGGGMGGSGGSYVAGIAM